MNRFLPGSARLDSTYAPKMVSAVEYTTTPAVYTNALMYDLSRLSCSTMWVKFSSEKPAGTITMLFRIKISGSLNALINVYQTGYTQNSAKKRSSAQLTPSKTRLPMLYGRA